MFWLAIILVFSPASAQDNSLRERKSIQEEQERQIQRLERLRQTIDSLSKRLEEKGRSRSAELLRAAAAQLDQSQLEMAMAAVIRDLEDDRTLQSLEKEQKLLKEIEELLAILLDRKDLEELEKQLQQLQDVAQGLDSLRSEQHQLSKAVEQLNNNSQTPEEKALDSQLSRLIQKQQELLNESEKTLNEQERSLADLQKELNALLKAQQEVIEQMQNRPAEESVEQAQATNEAFAQQEREIRRQVERMARTLQNSSETAENTDATSQLWQASEELNQGAEQLAQQKPENALQAAQNAAQAMQQAKQAIEQIANKQQDAVPAKLEALAKQQSELAQETQQLIDEVPQRLKKQELLPAQANSLQDHATDAQRAMQKASSELKSGNLSEAQAAQRDALEGMRKAQSGLQENRELDQEQKQEALQLAQKQREIQEKILQLARKMQENKTKNYPPSIQRAEQSAGQTAEELDRGNLEEAEPKAEETEKYLNQAKDEIETQRDKYLNLRQEELLFRIADELKSMIKAHAEALEATVAAENERNGADNSASRALRMKVLRISRSEEGVAEDCQRIAESLEKEGTKVYSYLLLSNKEDLVRVIELMGAVGKYQTGELVQGLQRDVQDRFEWLLQALKDEMETRKQQNSTPQGTNDGPGRNRLVPDVAELRMLKRMEVNMEQRTKRLVDLIEKGITDADMVQRDVERLANRHNRVTELFIEFKQRLGFE